MQQDYVLDILLYLFMNKIKTEPAKEESAFSDMYQKLKQLGFVYEKKEQILLPLYKRVEENWCRLFEKDGDLIHTTSLSRSQKELATCSSWKSSMSNWCIQHGISNQIRLFLFAITRECNWLIGQSSIKYIQCWFQTQNAIMNKVCDLVKTEQNTGNYDIEVMDYLSWAPIGMDVNKQWHTCPYTSNKHTVLKNFIIQHKGPLFYDSEEIESDPFLCTINHQYQEIGLERSRKIVLIHKEDQLKAVVLLYKGPLGINFSFLENRIEIIVDTNCQDDYNLVYSIGNLVHEMNSNSITGFTPIVTGHRFSEMLERNGAKILRQYTRHIWTKDAMIVWLNMFIEKYSLFNWFNGCYE